MNALKLIGTTLYVASSNSLNALDVSTPTVTPTLLGSFAGPGQIMDIAMGDNTIYVVDAYNNFYALSVTDPTNPTLATDGYFETYFSTNSNSRIAIGGDYAFVVENDSLQVINISDLQNLSSVSTYTPPSATLNGGIAVSGSYLYLTQLANNDSAKNDTFLVFDISNPSHLVKVGGADIGSYRYATDIAIVNDHAYVADGDEDSIYAINISDPTNPYNVGHVSTSGHSYGIAVDDNNVAYVADGTAGLFSFSMRSTSGAASFMNGNVGIGTTTPAFALTVINTKSGFVGTEGNDLVRNGDFSQGGTSWSNDGDWTFDNNSAIHVFNDYPSFLSQYIPTQSNETYRVSFGILNRTRGYVKVFLGGDEPTREFNTTGSSEYSLYIKSYGGSWLQFVPSPDFDGSITDVSVYHARQVDPTFVLYNNDGSRGIEFRGTNSSDNTLIGNDSGAFNNGFLVNSLGAFSAMYNTGSLVTAIGAGAASNNSGWFVNAIGTDALRDNRGSSVDALGDNALVDKQAGDYTVGIGSDDSENGFFRGTQKGIEKSVLIGPSSVTHVDSNATNTLTNVYAIGGRVTDSNQVVLGNSSTTETLLHGNVGIGSSSPTTKLAVEGDHKVDFSKQSAYASNSTMDVAVVGNYAYVADGYGGFKIFNIADKNNPKLLSTSETYSFARHIVVSGNRAYVADSQYVYVFDITDPTNPAFLSFFSPSGSQINSLVIKDSILYVGSGSMITAYDVTDDASDILGYAYQDSDVRGMAISGTTLLVVDNSKLYTLDISQVRHDLIQ
ncbi:hypothetical protein EB052_00035 [bacterium]|nr:hypothetical protein [bacterium]